MSTLELRLSLIEQLTKIDDEKLLTQIKNLINRSCGAAAGKEKHNPAQMTLEELNEEHLEPSPKRDQSNLY